MKMLLDLFTIQDLVVDVSAWNIKIFEFKKIDENNSRILNFDLII